jgi:hypothetical protein
LGSFRSWHKWLHFVWFPQKLASFRNSSRHGFDPFETLDGAVVLASCLSLIARQQGKTVGLASEAVEAVFAAILEMGGICLAGRRGPVERVALAL